MDSEEESGQVDVLEEVVRRIEYRVFLFFMPYFWFLYSSVEDLAAFFVWTDFFAGFIFGGALFSLFLLVRSKSIFCWMRWTALDWFHGWM
jgi:hypothetical protein